MPDKKSIDKKFKHIIFRFPLPLIAELKVMSGHTGLPVAVIVRKAINEHLKPWRAHGKDKRDREIAETIRKIEGEI